MSDFKAKKAPNSISAGALPSDPARGARSAPPHLQLTLSQPSGPQNNLPPQICIPKSAYDHDDGFDDDDDDDEYPIDF